MLDPRRVLTFREVARHGSFSRAGEALSMTVTSRLLAGQLHGVHIAAAQGEPARRSLYALLPDAGARPIDQAMVHELEQAALRATARM